MRKRRRSLTASQTPPLKSEFIAPGIEHIQITRGAKSEKESTGPWFINILRIDLTKARLAMVHAMDEAVGLETTSSMAARYGALAAVNSGYFRTTGTYRGDSIGVGVLDGKILGESNNARAAVGLIEKNGAQQLIFGHVTFAGELIVNARTKHAIDGLNRPRDDNELIIFTPEFHRTTLTEPNGVEIIVRSGRVSEIRDQKGSSVIPAGGFVISASGTAREWVLRNLRLKRPARLNLKLSTVENEQGDRWTQREQHRWRRAATDQRRTRGNNQRGGKDLAGLRQRPSSTNRNCKTKIGPRAAGDCRWPPDSQYRHVPHHARRLADRIRRG